MTYSAIAEILVIGNEILIGDIQDTNTSWLCGLINSKGGHVARGTMLRDNVDEIAAEVGRALERGADVIFTSGGLGPTADDLTLAAVAKGLGLPLELHPEALRMVKEQYDNFHARGIMAQGGLNPGREKMAWLPKGGVPLFNPGPSYYMKKLVVPAPAKGVVDMNAPVHPFRDALPRADRP